MQLRGPLKAACCGAAAPAAAQSGLGPVQKGKEEPALDTEPLEAVATCTAGMPTALIYKSEKFSAITLFLVLSNIALDVFVYFYFPIPQKNLNYKWKSCSLYFSIVTRTSFILI